MDALISIVAPLHNEEACLEGFYRTVKDVLAHLPVRHEFIFVDDGSKDRSAEILRELRRRDPSVRIVSFSRNFGHQVAIKAGIDHAAGDALIIIDTDLQDPPAAIPKLIAKWREGYDVVYAVRASREGEGVFKRLTAACYYRLFRKLAEVDIPVDTGDFRLISRRVADVMRQVREKSPYIRGLISWVGFAQTGVSIERSGRFAGRTKYSVRRMLRLAWSGVTHFSFLPLQLATYLGAAAFLVSLAGVAAALYARLVLHEAVPDRTLLVIAVTLMGAVQLVTLGIIGGYLALAYDEARARPLYIVREKTGFDGEGGGGPSGQNR